MRVLSRNPYFSVPREPIGQEAFVVIRDAMKRHRACSPGILVARAAVPG
jgi:hypothetical protein